MPHRPHRPHRPMEGPRRNVYTLLLLFAVFLLASPFLRWWVALNPPWYLPYLVWGGIVLLVYLLSRRFPHDF